MCWSPVVTPKPEISTLKKDNKRRMYCGSRITRPPAARTRAGGLSSLVMRGCPTTQLVEQSVDIGVVEYPRGIILFQHTSVMLYALGR